MRLLLSVFIILQSGNEIAQRFFPLLLKDNLKLEFFDVSRTYKVNDNKFILIGKSKTQDMKHEGHRLLYLSADSLSNGFTLKYISKSKGEAYVYNPHFFKLKNEIIIAVEEGYEYMSGVDIFRLNNDEVDFLGYIPVAGKDRDSIIEQMKIERQEDDYKITFEGKIEYTIGTDNIIDGSRLKVTIDKNGLKINEN
jgi:hypothetical protein